MLKKPAAENCRLVQAGMTFFWTRDVNEPQELRMFSMGIEI